MIFRLIIFLSFFAFAETALAKVSKAKNKKTRKISRTTAVSICKRDRMVQINNIQNNVAENIRVAQAIIVAIETIGESKCRTTGKNKANQYAREGWECTGLAKDNIFSCVDKKAASFALYNGIHLDHLSFTNLLKHRALIAYLNPESYKTCLEDKADLEAAGVTDAKCFKRR